MSHAFCSAFICKTGPWPFCVVVVHYRPLFGILLPFSPVHGHGGSPLSSIAASNRHYSRHGMPACARPFPLDPVFRLALRLDILEYSKVIV